jgi:hypothetical protein
MKKLLFTLSIAATVFLTSCGANQEVADKMADEMCSAMSKYKKDDPSTLMEMANAMQAIAGKEQEYKDVTEAQLKETMEKKCPDGYKMMIEMSEAADAEPAEAK